MNIYSKVEYQWSERQQRYILLRKVLSGKWTTVAECKGASSQQKQISSSQQQFYDTLQKDMSTQFANQSNILSALNRSLSPILQGGPNQFGFSTPEVNALNSQAIQGTAQAYSNAAKSLRAQQAAQGGGNTLLPSGVSQQQQASLSAAAANNQSNALLGIQQAGYNVGRQQYNNAVSQLGGVASMYNPTGYAGAANTAGNNAFNSATTVYQENKADSPWATVGGILGGVAGSFLGPIGTSLGSKLGGMIGGGASGSGWGGGSHASDFGVSGGFGQLV